MKLDFSLYQGKTRLKHWWKEVKKHFELVQKAHDELQGNISDEKLARKTADAELSEDIKSEAASRTLEDIALQGNIDAATVAIEAATAAIEKETQDRTREDAELRNAIRLEENNRTRADNQIADGSRTISPDLSDDTTYGNINLGTKNIMLYGGAFFGLTSLFHMAQKISEGGQADKLLQEADNVLQGNIDAEAAERQGADEELQGNIEDVDERLSGIQAEVNILTGSEVVDGSVDNKITNAINAFASSITDDGTINTFAEVLNWIVSHGADFAALVGQVNENKGSIASISDGTTAIGPSLNGKTKYFGSSISNGLQLLTSITECFEFPFGTSYSRIDTPIMAYLYRANLSADGHSGYGSISEIAAAVKTASDSLPTSAAIAALDWD